MALTAGVLGASGYAGGELLRLLASHPAVSAVAWGGSTRAGARIASLHPQLTGVFDGALGDLTETAATPVDVCFCCLPGGALPPLAGEIAAEVVIDLSDDYRDDPAWAYGLPEFARAEVASASRVANPGCYPTAVLLGLVPFARAGLIDTDVIVDAISGYSGAGRQVEDRLLHASAAGSAQAYGPTPHRHVAEMERQLQRLSGLESTISFTPHLAPMARGIVVTARARPTSEISDADALSVLAEAYEGEAFVDVIEQWPQSKSLSGTNRAHVSARLDGRANWLICSAALDNLGKGAAGQAVQNANIVLGLEETTGLSSLGIWP
ncbi:MAG: N-acetyl-gamma-glutamyl-phosphate reductase [Actinomycetota bacterium]|nr:N-acetyl-gamma-glutamyl-phosphate reductase [Actinomycetota bacterium]